ncbi:MAG TPA: citrate transporter [Phycisphaerales bacterium]|nr:citrate transporter [Phycisphaerales bacterium]
MHLPWIALGVFAAVYAFVSFSTKHRAKTVWIGAGLLMLIGALLRDQDPAGVLSPDVIVRQAINWNVLGILTGAMLIADLFVHSRVPVLLASRIAAVLRKPHWILLGICALSGVLSMFVDNVTTLLIVSPLALAIARSEKTSPVPLLIGIAVSANLQGAATMVGDPPSMILASSLKLTFNDFFVHRGRASMFFFMQAGAIAGGAVLYLVFRRIGRERIRVAREPVRTWVPAILILVMIAFLASASVLDPDFRWLAGTGMTTLGILAVAWHWRREPRTTVRLLKRYDLPTILFLAGIFVLAHALQGFGWIAALARQIAGLTGDSSLATFLILVWGSVLASAFVDNIPYVAAALPIAHSLAAMVGGDPFLYGAGLMMGACLGGNITPIGASCNVVAVGLLRREGYQVTFWEFARIGLPFTLAATSAGALALWLTWR